MTATTITTALSDIIAPREQEGTRATLRRWLKQDGDVVRRDEPVVELETDKVIVEIPAPCDGVLQVLVSEGRDLEPGELLGRVGQRVAEAPDKPSIVDSNTVVTRASAEPQQRFSPVVRRLLAEHKLNPAELQGHGRDGRLTREDVLAAIADQTSQPQAEKCVEPVMPGSVTQAPSVGGLQVPHSPMRRKIAEHMQHSITIAPHVTAVFEADCTAIIAHRQHHKARFAEQGVNLTFTAYFVAAAAEAMKVVPEVNSRWYADYLEIFPEVNIGVGASLGNHGLIVPVIHQVQQLSLSGIATRLQEITASARNGTLKPSDVQGGTFTISNHGVSGSLLASPIIINQPQSAILGIGAIEKRVVVRELDGVDVFQARSRAYVSLTIDHRVLDGSQANAWLSRFVAVLQSWPLEG